MGWHKFREKKKKRTTSQYFQKSLNETNLKTPKKIINGD
jgi:hypothetical protein